MRVLRWALTHLRQRRRSSPHPDYPRLKEHEEATAVAASAYAPIFLSRFQSSLLNGVPLFLNVHWCTCGRSKVIIRIHRSANTKRNTYHGCFQVWEILLVGFIRRGIVA